MSAARTIAVDAETARAPVRDAAPGPSGAFPLALTGVSKQWPKMAAPVLADVDLALDIGTTTWIGGLNGVGKTTLLRIAAGLIDPDEGRVEAWGNPPAARRANFHRLVSFLPAGDRGLYARLTVRRQLEFWSRVILLDRRSRGPRVDRAIEEFDLGELAERRVDRLSMGQRQRVRIAMAFLGGPETLLLDEPLNSLDDRGIAILDGAIDRLLAAGGCVLWCSPSGLGLERDFDAAFLLDGGRLVAA